MSDFPGVELYPSIEVLDGLHPPAGREMSFPVPVWLTADEIEHAINGRLVTKVVYLEEPRIAEPFEIQTPDAQLTIENTRNVLAEADQRGRPLLIVRVGGRLPPTRGDSRAFFCKGAPIDFRLPVAPVRDVPDTPPLDSQSDPTISRTPESVVLPSEPTPPADPSQP